MVQLSLLTHRPATEDHQIMDIGRHRRSRTNAGRWPHGGSFDTLCRKGDGRARETGAVRATRPFERPPPEGKARRPKIGLRTAIRRSSSLSRPRDTSKFSRWNVASRKETVIKRPSKGPKAEGKK